MFRITSIIDRYEGGNSSSSAQNSTEKDTLDFIRPSMVCWMCLIQIHEIINLIRRKSECELGWKFAKNEKNQKQTKHK